MIPTATYRLQFHRGFPFAAAIPLAPYLAGLGISHVYSSPIGMARSGSKHGYDQIDPTRINPELGGEEGFRALVAALKSQRLGLILDIVPNHMAVGKADNRWWLDVLKRGRESEHAELFDIDWAPADTALHGKVAAPFLGGPYAEVLASGDLELKRDEATGELAVWAHDAHAFPLRPEDQEALAPGEDPQARFDGTTEAGREALHALLERQNYHLAWWKTAGDEINWRRFFDVTELAAVKVERDDVFDLIHALPLRLYAEGLIDGVRVDHVDGLADPAGYCRKLRARLDAAENERPADANPGRAYFVVEKILAQGERLSPEWLTDGTTGYDYMNQSSALLHDPVGEEALTILWVEVSGRTGEFEAEERRARLETLRRSFAGQRDACVLAFHRVACSDLSTRDLTQGMIRRALNTLLSVFPVYRTYGTGVAAPASDAPILHQALERAQPFVAPGEEPVLQRIADWLAGEGPGDERLRRRAVQRFQQLSAPVSAKAVEDTAFYRYGRLLSRDDVGGDPARLAASVADMHRANAERRASFPHAMLTTATHDHKRGEDVRARLAVLSERADAWGERVRRWGELNATIVEGVEPLDLYPLYQTLVGAWPLDLEADNAAGLAAFGERVGGWWRKALREAKLNSSWAAPNEAYESQCEAFLEAALDPSRSASFLADLMGFVAEIAPAGAVNGLTQALLRCTAPGVPDLYQGCERWDFSLVDPDNRRPVDYAARRTQMVDTVSFDALLGAWRTGQVKQALIGKVLDLRRRWTDVFSGGDYIPVQVHGSGKLDVISFLRRRGVKAVLVVAPLHVDGHVDVETLSLKGSDLGDLYIDIPGRGLADGRDIFSEAFVSGSKPPLADLLAHQPFACIAYG